VPALALKRQKDGHGVMLKLAESLASPMQFSLWQVELAFRSPYTGWNKPISSRIRGLGIRD